MICDESFFGNTIKGLKPYATFPLIRIKFNIHNPYIVRWKKKIKVSPFTHLGNVKRQHF